MFGSPAGMNMLIFGIKNTAMSDAEIEALSGGYAAWTAAGFTAGARLNSITAPTIFAGTPAGVPGILIIRLGRSTMPQYRRAASIVPSVSSARSGSTSSET